MDDQAQSLVEEQTEQMKEAESLLAIDAAIKDRIVKIDELREAMKPQKEMLQSYLENDPVYQEHSKIAKDAAKQKSLTKKQLLMIPAGRALVEKLDTMKEDMRELQEGLSHYLYEYQRMTGTNEIEGADGELRQIVHMAKLVRKTNLNK